MGKILEVTKLFYEKPPLNPIAAQMVVETLQVLLLTIHKCIDFPHEYVEQLGVLMVLTILGVMVMDRQMEYIEEAVGQTIILIPIFIPQVTALYQKMYEYL
jgi:hypothetical protein